MNEYYLVILIIMIIFKIFFLVGTLLEMEDYKLFSIDQDRG